MTRAAIAEYPQGFTIDTTYGRGPGPMVDARECECRLGRRCAAHAVESLVEALAADRYAPEEFNAFERGDEFVGLLDLGYYGTGEDFADNLARVVEWNRGLGAASGFVADFEAYSIVTVSRERGTK